MKNRPVRVTDVKFQKKKKKSIKRNIQAEIHITSCNSTIRITKLNNKNYKNLQNGLLGHYGLTYVRQGEKINKLTFATKTVLVQGRIKGEKSDNQSEWDLREQQNINFQY